MRDLTRINIRLKRLRKPAGARLKEMRARQLAKSTSVFQDARLKYMLGTKKFYERLDRS